MLYPASLAAHEAIWKAPMAPIAARPTAPKAAIPIPPIALNAPTSSISSSAPAPFSFPSLPPFSLVHRFLRSTLSAWRGLNTRVARANILVHSLPQFDAKKGNDELLHSSTLLVARPCPRPQRHRREVCKKNLFYFLLFLPASLLFSLFSSRRIRCDSRIRIQFPLGWERGLSLTSETFPLEDGGGSRLHLWNSYRKIVNHALLRFLFLRKERAAQRKVEKGESE